MAGLAETTARLAKARRSTDKQTGGASRARMRSIPDFGANPGALAARVYAPETLAAGAPLVVVLRGCTQDAEAYAVQGGWLTLADRLGFAVLAPGQSAANNPNRCFNWFSPADTARGRGEAASIAAMVEHVRASLNLDPSRVFVTGLSAGGAMTMVLLAAYPELFAGGAVIAGLPYAVAANVQQALQAMAMGDGRPASALGALMASAAPRSDRMPRLSVWHGEADHTVSPANAQDIVRQWTSVQGLTEDPDEIRRTPGRTQALWRGPDGDVVLDLNLLVRLGHGAPLSTLGPDGLGAAAPYMLEAGVSSSREICSFWGLGEVLGTGAPTTEAGLSGAAAIEPPGSWSGDLGERVMSAVSPHVSKGVQDIIAGALRLGGLKP